MDRLDHPLEGPSVRLRPLVAADANALYAIATTPSAMLRWRFRGGTPSPESFYASLWLDTLVLFAIVDKRTNSTLGVFSCVSPDFRNQHAQVSILMDDATWGRGKGMEAMAVATHYVFAAFPFRKLYAETMEFNFDQFAFGEGRFFEVEGRLIGHEYFDGRFWDFLTLAIYREQALDEIDRLLGRWLPRRPNITTPERTNQ